MILAKLKETAESSLGRPITHAVITVPAAFNNAQRQATKDACVIAGLPLLSILNEPSAAALDYCLDKNWLELRYVIVFDLGGGGLDVSLMTVASGVINVIAIAGDTHLGGEDIDTRLVNYFADEFRQRYHKGSCAWFFLY
jgi:molecular chaperone DnaK (HSP70)